MRPPTIDKELTEFSQDAKTRHEEFVAIFGRYYFWLRSVIRDRVRQLTGSIEAREQLSSAFRGPYEQIAVICSEEQKAAAIGLADAGIDEFAKLLLSLLSATGVSHRLGKDHALRFRLVAEVCEVEEGKVVMQETINRGGTKHFADYWGEWLLAESKRTVSGVTTSPE